jgi:hypothetical protein
MGRLGYGERGGSDRCTILYTWGLPVDLVAFANPILADHTIPTRPGGMYWS